MKKALFTGLTDEQALGLRALPMEAAIRFWDAFEGAAIKEGEASHRVAVRALCLADLFYLLVRVCRRVDMLHPWVYARCREVEAGVNGYVDLWFREGYKSTIKTFGLTMQRILKNPDITFGFFSHTRPIAKAFLRQIMREFESNQVLHACFPDVLWGLDVKQAPKWSEDDGIIVRRRSNPNEATIEAWGLVDGQPTSKHFQVLNYDDIVTDKSVTTPEMIQKTTDAFGLSSNLGARGGEVWITGTYYHYGDSYFEIVRRGSAKPRVYPGSDDGTETGKPILLTQEQWDKKRRVMGPYIFSCQMLLKPVGDATQGFKREWLRHFTNPPPLKTTNNYLLVDAASSKKRGSDYTAMWLVQLGRDSNYYCTPICRDRLNLTERTARLFKAHQDFKPKQVRYEKYGLMADIEHMKAVMETDHYRFDIKEVGGQTSKEDRIKRLIPLFEQGRIWLPRSVHATDWEGRLRDLVHDFTEEEYAAFPVGLHDDMLDSLSRIAEPDLKLTWPKEEAPPPAPPARRSHGSAATAWMA
jgi:phage terminase large subunit-like protein